MEILRGGDGSDRVSYETNIVTRVSHPSTDRNSIYRTPRLLYDA